MIGWIKINDKKHTIFQLYRQSFNHSAIFINHLTISASSADAPRYLAIGLSILSVQFNVQLHICTTGIVKNRLVIVILQSNDNRYHIYSYMFTGWWMCHTLFI